MAAVITSQKASAPGAKKVFVSKGAIGKAAAIAVSLPTKPSAASDDMSEYHFLIHGEKKIGKTTFTTVEEGVFLLTFDPKQKALEIMQEHCPNWETFEAYLKALEAAAAAGKYPYKRVVIDGADIWYARCQDWACRQLGIKHPSEEDWGKGWDKLKVTFANAVDRLLALPGGVWFISHSQWKEIETRQKGVKVTKLVPNLRSGGEEILVGRVDGWFAYDYKEDERILIVKGDERTGAGHRVRGHFQTPDGRAVIEIPMGNDEFVAWTNFKAAFNNKQPFVDTEDRDNYEPPSGAGKGAATAKASAGPAAPAKKSLFIKKK